MPTGNVKIVLLGCLWDAAINILTFQGYLNYQNRLTFIVFKQPSIFNSKFGEFVCCTVLEFELNRTLEIT